MKGYTAFPHSHGTPPTGRAPCMVFAMLVVVVLNNTTKRLFLPYLTCSELPATITGRPPLLCFIWSPDYFRFDRPQPCHCGNSHPPSSKSLASKMKIKPVFTEGLLSPRALSWEVAALTVPILSKGNQDFEKLGPLPMVTTSTWQDREKMVGANIFPSF